MKKVDIIRFEDYSSIFIDGIYVELIDTNNVTIHNYTKIKLLDKAWPFTSKLESSLRIIEELEKNIKESRAESK